MKLEEEQGLVNEQLGNPDSYNDPEKAKELNEQTSKLARKLQQRNYEWEIETEKLLEIQYMKNNCSAFQLGFHFYSSTKMRWFLNISVL